jgi:P27 family predicted phage terminase small subunit
MRGRKPKPTTEMIAAGDPNKIGARKLQAKLNAEPAATRGLPACPDHLHRLARQAWNFWAVELEEMDLDARPDAMMLEGACVGYERAVLADRMIQRHGLIREVYCLDKRRKRVLLRSGPHPAIRISAVAWAQVRSFCSEFGLSPASRARLSVEKPNEAGDELVKILSRPRSEAKLSIN